MCLLNQRYKLPQCVDVTSDFILARQEHSTNTCVYSKVVTIGFGFHKTKST